MKLSPLLPPSAKQVDHLLMVDDEVFGVLNPGYLISSSPDEPGYIEIIGPKGSARVESADSSGIIAALLATKVLSLGSAGAILRVNDLLLDPRTSRTTSYVCSIAESCDHVQEVIHAWHTASVCVVGCGGIGSLATMILSGAGIKRLTLVDPDVIEESNLNRQFFWALADVGRYKVEALKTRVLERFPWVEINAVSEYVSAQTAPFFISESDAILFTADEPPGISGSIGSLARKHGKVFVGAGYFLDNLIVECNVQESVKQGRLFFVSESPVMPSFGPSNSEVAGVATSALLLRLAGILANDEKSKIWKPSQWPQ